MSEMIPLAVGVGIGLLLGGVLAGLWVTTRLRAQSQRAEATVDELRKQLDLERQEGTLVRRELTESQQARVAAETRRR
jgi:DNA recombination protein RmuC